LFPSQFVNAQLLVKTLQNVVTVPTAAIQRGSPGAYVYVVNADGTVAVRQIKVGPTDGSSTAVNSGLTAGENVVVDGTDRLRDGLRVAVVALNGQPTRPGAPTGPGAAAAPAAPTAGRTKGSGQGHNPAGTPSPPPSGSQ
jgi:multidrug efflux system membrane fusion protein